MVIFHLRVKDWTNTKHQNCFSKVVLWSTQGIESKYNINLHIQIWLFFEWAASSAVSLLELLVEAKN